MGENSDPKPRGGVSWRVVSGGRRQFDETSPTSAPTARSLHLTSDFWPVHAGGQAKTQITTPRAAPTYGGRTLRASPNDLLRELREISEKLPQRPSMPKYVLTSQIVDTNKIASYPQKNQKSAKSNLPVDNPDWGGDHLEDLDCD